MFHNLLTKTYPLHTFWRFFIHRGPFGEILTVDEHGFVIVLIMPAYGIFPSTPGKGLTLFVPPSPAMIIVKHFYKIIVKNNTEHCNCIENCYKVN